MGQYDVETRHKRGGCCRHRFWGWKSLLRYDLGTSALGWHRFARVWALFLVRFLLSLWALVAMVYGMVELELYRTQSNGIVGAPWWTWGIYLGNWAFFSLLVYLVAFTYFSCREARSGAMGSTTFVERFLWANYEVAWALLWSSAVAYWFLVRPECTLPPHDCSKTTWYEYHVHGISLLWLLFELFFNMMRWKWLHVVFALAFLVAWFLFSAVWHAVTGVHVYAVQDADVGGALTYAFYPVLLVGVVLFHMCGWGWSVALEKCYKGSRRVTDRDFFDGDPVQVNDCC